MHISWSACVLFSLLLLDNVKSTACVCVRVHTHLMQPPAAFVQAKVTTCVRTYTHTMRPCMHLLLSYRPNSLHVCAHMHARTHMHPHNQWDHLLLFCCSPIPMHTLYMATSRRRKAPSLVNFAMGWTERWMLLIFGHTIDSPLLCNLIMYRMCHPLFMS